MTLLIAILLGILTGLRTFAPLAVLSGAALMGALSFEETQFSALGSWWAFVPLLLLAIGEIAADKAPGAPPRTSPPALGARLIAGAVIGAAAGSLGDAAWIGAVLGLLGAAAGTYGGLALRNRLGRALGGDRKAALIEDAVVVIGAVLLVAAL